MRGWRVALAAASIVLGAAPGAGAQPGGPCPDPDLLAVLDALDTRARHDRAAACAEATAGAARVRYRRLQARVAESLGPEAVATAQERLADALAGIRDEVGAVEALQRAAAALAVGAAGREAHLRRAALLERVLELLPEWDTRNRRDARLALAAAFDRAAALSQGAAALAPLRRAADAYEGAGRAMVEQGEFAGAWLAFQRARAMLDQLLVAAPADPRVRRDLVAAHLSLADTAITAERRAPAERHFAAAEALLQDLLAEDPTGQRSEALRTALYQLYEDRDRALARFDGKE